MKITFIFTDAPDLASLSKDDIFSSHFEFPDAALLLPDCRERVLAIAGLVGQLTKSVLHITCKELHLTKHPVKLVMNEDSHMTPHAHWDTTILFERFDGRRNMRRQLKIRNPISSPIRPLIPSKRRDRKVLDKCLAPIGRDAWCDAKRNLTDEQRSYLKHIDVLTDHCLVLLNAETFPDSVDAWRYRGFHPHWKNSASITRYNKLVKKRNAERRRREREEAKRKAREAKLAEQGKAPSSVPETGAGRRVGPVPGVFKGVQFRSQLEIRFVTQLEDKQIRWVYEGERLGEGSYLVDFYLPDLNCWVEVKGRFEPRDHYLLRDVAAFLKRERGERLYVYTQGKCFKVNPSNFREVTQDKFWSEVLTLR